MIDYFSFTIPVNQTAKPATLHDLPYWLELYGLSETVISFWRENVTETPVTFSRVPYRVGMRYSQVGLSHAYGGHSHALVEISGQGIALLRDNNLLDALISSVQHEDVTRIDLCHDYPETTPYDLTSLWGVRKKVQSRSLIESGTGVTMYLGSRKSDSFARVYQYNAPHPRAGLTRVEHQIKRQRARLVTQALQTAQNELELYNAFNARVFEQADNASDSKLDTVLSKEKSATTSNTWLYKQVFPALRKAIHNKQITLIEVVEELTK